MKTRMRHTFFAALAVLMGGTALGTASAEDYPSRAISLIVPYTAGGQTDQAGRLIANAMAEELDQTVTVVNKPGAGGVTGTAEIAAANPNGYTIGLLTSTPILQKPYISETPYTYENFDYICRVNHNPLLFAVDKNSDIENVEDLIEFGREGRLTYGSSSEASVQHIAMMTLSEQAGVEMVHVPNTSDTNNIRNILSGVLTGTLLPASVIEANADTIKPIGIMDSERLAGFPDIETFAEAGYDVTAAVWGVLSAPEGLEEDVLTTLREACAAAQDTEEFKSEITRLGMEPAYLGGEESKELVGREADASLEALTKLGFAN